ncbi:hypothetical protein ACFV8T_33545 [Streptomyces sp. NPDC059832]|uniref:hypothetical protein n=1 Tax=unclassified Streptomyces TaxID=2593676 RepID=UPI00365AADFE
MRKTRAELGGVLPPASLVLAQVPHSGRTALILRADFPARVRKARFQVAHVRSMPTW